MNLKADSLLPWFEKNVQWFAIGLGVLWLLLMAWWYLVIPPVTVEVDGQRLGPARLTEHVKTNGVTPLQNQLQNSNVSPVPLPDLNNAIDRKADPEIKIAKNTGISGANTKVPETAAEVSDVNVAMELPVPPLPEILAMESGRSFVTTTSGETKDIAWVRVPFTIHASELRQAMLAANVRPGLRSVFLRKELIRQEVMPDGSFGPEEVIAPINAELFGELPPKENTREVRAYLDQVGKFQGEILQPNFYTILSGDRPGEPRVQAPEPEPEPVVEPGNNDPDQPRTRQPPPQRGRGGGDPYADPDRPRQVRDGGSGMFDGGGRRPPPPRDPYADPDSPPGSPPPGAPAGDPYADPYGNIPGDNAGNNGFPPANPGAPGNPFPPGEGFLPPGEFDPQTLGTNISGWAYDVSAKPGRTYRYKVRYYMKNPLFGNENFVDPDKANLAKEYILVSTPGGDEDWSEPIKVEPLTCFFVTNFAGAGASIDVYRWQNGKVNKASFRPQAGDPIGVPTDGINYDTGWLVVDYRPGNVVLLITPTGEMVTRTRDDDADSQEERRQLDWMVNNAQALAAKPAATQ